MEERSYRLNVTGIMTAPRHEITLARTYIDMALKQAGVPLVVSGGVFYGQCMQRMLADSIDSGVDVAITIDFDSMFTAKNIERLLSILVGNDQIDAVAAMQCRRGKPFPLLTVAGKTSQPIDGSPFKVDTAHFGLTAIDLHKLKDVPKPWFFSQPDSNGDWGEGKIDDDIWFWKQWRESGLSVYIDPLTSIGHMEEMVVSFDEKMQPIHRYPNQWAADTYKTAPKKSGTLVFVGANRANKAMINLIDKHQRSYLFEPLPDVADSLRESFAERDDVTIIEAACGLQAGKETLRRYNDNGESSSLGVVTQQAKDLYDSVDWTEHQQYQVSVINLYDWWYSCEIGEIETLVIDAQGMDLAILKTMKPLLENGQIKFIQCEAEGNGFKHYEGLPTNSEQAFAEFMSQFPWYVSSRLDGRLEIQPDLIWGLDEKAFAERELCQA